MLNGTISTSTPQFSVIIAVYNDWGSLEQCLRSLEQQKNGPDFEAIIVDDGSEETAPDSIHRWSRCYPLTVVRQPHAGIAAARNRGIRTSRGSVLVFTDADCRLQTGCLATLSAAIIDFPQYSCFQLHLAGDCATIVGRAEELRLTALQNQLLQPNGSIRYLNTAGFAIRRGCVDIEAGLFDPVALRAEDTLLLANLIQRGELPFFVFKAIVQHAIPLSLMECLRKDVRSAWLAGKTYEIIAAKGVRVRMSHKERLDMLRWSWKNARQNSIGGATWFVLLVRHVLQRIGFAGYRYLRIRPTRDAAMDTSRQR